MINVLLPAMGDSTFFADSFFPKMLTEINGKTMIETVVYNFSSLADMNSIFVFSEKDCLEFHLDDTARLLSDKTKVITLHAQTAGALCTCLMAVDLINNDMPLIIANSDQIIDVNYDEVLDHFESQQADVGLITFPDVHPQWSYCKKAGDEVVEVAEKRPLSKNAIAGFYYYRKGSDFVQAAKQALRKQSSLNGRYYISASVNELILMGRKVRYYDIVKDQFHPFYSPAKIKEYEGDLAR